MDAKSKANFINSVSSGAAFPDAEGNSAGSGGKICVKCGTANNSDDIFCIYCGTKLTAADASRENTPVFDTINEKEQPNEAGHYIEPNSVFANGLPEWSLVPPQVMVRRR